LCYESRERVLVATVRGDHAVHDSSRSQQTLSDTRHQLTRTSRRNRAPFLVLATIAVLAAGVLPTCRVNDCSSMPTIASVHVNMPCCALDTSIAPRDFDRPHAAAFAGSLHTTYSYEIVNSRVQPEPAHASTGIRTLTGEFA
jgi:hypothetical protein